MLQVIKAEDVRDGEPRWWCPDDVYAARTLEWIVTSNLHTEWRGAADAFTLAIVDRPAPTPTPAPGLDLDAVERAERAMTPGPWHGSGCSFGHGIVQRTGNGFAHGFQDDAPCSFDVGAANAAGIVALRNAAPALIAEVRALRLECASLRRACAADKDAVIAADNIISGAYEGEKPLRAAIESFRAKLAEAKRLGRDACELAKAYADDAREYGGDTAAADAIAAALEAL